MKSIVIVVLVAVLLFAGCTQEIVVPSSVEPVESVGLVQPILSTKEPPVTSTWISPGKVTVGNFYPGARAEYSITIHNGNDYEASFAVTYRYPDHVGKDYTKPVTEAAEWITITDSMVILIPKETRDVLVILAIPDKVEVTIEPKWEFWVSVKQQGQGMIQTELCSRWLIHMR